MRGRTMRPLFESEDQIKAVRAWSARSCRRNMPCLRNSSRGRSSPRTPKRALFRSSCTPRSRTNAADSARGACSTAGSGCHSAGTPAPRPGDDGLMSTPSAVGNSRPRADRSFRGQATAQIAVADDFLGITAVGVSPRWCRARSSQRPLEGRYVPFRQQHGVTVDDAGPGR